jgi:hypothetical protein
MDEVYAVSQLESIENPSRLPNQCKAALQIEFAGLGVNGLDADFDWRDGTIGGHGRMALAEFDGRPPRREGGNFVIGNCFIGIKFSTAQREHHHTPSQPCSLFAQGCSVSRAIADLQATGKRCRLFFCPAICQSDEQILHSTSAPARCANAKCLAKQRPSRSFFSSSVRPELANRSSQNLLLQFCRLVTPCFCFG